MLSGHVREAMRAEHGLSLLISVRKGAAEHHLLYDTGVTPDGMVENMRRLQSQPGDFGPAEPPKRGGTVTSGQGAGDSGDQSVSPSGDLNPVP
jgi:hypothetical protein